MNVLYRRRAAVNTSVATMKADITARVIQAIDSWMTTWDVKVQYCCMEKICGGFYCDQ